jgi:putative zinc finger protein
MNCQKANDLLCAYIDGEVIGRQCEALETHLGQCSGCRKEAETLRSAIALLEAPKTMVRPEGLLEEFKAKYLPEAEAAPAPRWGIRIPVMPKLEWPSLSRMAVPVGGLAAAAAAALVVALHSQPVVPKQGSAVSGPAARQVAARPPQPDATLPVAAVAPAVSGTESETIPARSEAGTSTVPVRAQVRPHSSEHRPGTGPHFARRRPQHRALMLAALAPLPHHRHLRSRSALVASRLPLVPVVPVAEVERESRRHEEAVPSPEMQWQDQVVMIRRTTAAAPADDGYGEASSKDLVTGKTEKTAAFGSSPSPAAPAGDPGGDSGGGR